MTEINREARLARINLYNKNPVICRVCKKALPYDKRTNTFCSHSCSARYNNLGVNRHSASGVLIDKYCATCGKVLDQHNKIYCSIKCHKDHIHTEYIKNWLSGKNDGSRGIGEISRHIRRYMLEQAENQCSECGWGKINPTTGHSFLAIHHIDGHSDNNHPDNLRVLCPNCHSLTPTFGSLNIGNGRRV